MKVSFATDTLGDLRLSGVSYEENQQILKNFGQFRKN